MGNVTRLNNKITVSIIMPVYEAAATLERCVSSIQAQTLTNWELLAVDDGSLDHGGEMLDRMALADSRIKVIHQPNRGVAAARQAGLECARGNYAIHIDADDWIDATMLEELVNEAEHTGAGIVICDFYLNNDKQEKIIKQIPSALTPDAILRDMFVRLHGSCCNKLISSEYYNLERFDIGLNLSEDLLFICKILNHNPRIAYVPKAFYHYVTNVSGSMSTTYTVTHFYQLVAVYNQLEYIYRNESDILNLIRKRKASYLGNVGALSVDISAKQLRYELGRKWFLDIMQANVSIYRRLIILAAAIGLKPIALFFNSRRIKNAS